MVFGEVFAVTFGTTMMPVLSANSWDTLLMVCLCAITCQYINESVRLNCEYKYWLLYSAMGVWS